MPFPNRTREQTQGLILKLRAALTEDELLCISRCLRGVLTLGDYEGMLRKVIPQYVTAEYDNEVIHLEEFLVPLFLHASGAPEEE